MEQQFELVYKAYLKEQSLQEFVSNGNHMAWLSLKDGILPFGPYQYWAGHFS